MNQRPSRFYMEQSTRQERKKLGNFSLRIHSQIKVNGIGMSLFYPPYRPGTNLLSFALRLLYWDQSVMTRSSFRRKISTRPLTDQKTLDNFHYLNITERLSSQAELENHCTILFSYGLRKCSSQKLIINTETLLSAAQRLVMYWENYPSHFLLISSSITW